MARLISVNVGLPRDISWRGQTVHTAIWKAPIAERRMVRRLNLDGDGQGDLAGHGGEHRAVMVYQMDSYRYWEKHFNRSDFAFGQFGENFTIEGLTDDEVCVGDRYRIGGALFEVTQPRVTCYRVGIRMDDPQMASLLVAHHRPGFYFRVLEEGEVGAGDEIRKMADGPEKMTVTEIDALLYLPGRSRDQLERALRISALSTGWRGSFRSLLDQGSQAASPAWSGFRPLRVVRFDRETSAVTSVSLEAADGSPLPAALPGQFVVVKLRPRPDMPAIVRNYSLSGPPDAGVYRMSVKQEMNGVGSTFVHDRVHVGDVLDVSAPRGSFTLAAGTDPVILVSAGIGATPVLSMLHSLASTHSPREIWWLYGARNRREHPFAEEARALLKKVAQGRSYIVYSKPEPVDRLGQDFDAPGHLSIPLLDQIGVPRVADFYLCGPAAFLNSFSTDLRGWGVEATRIHSEAFGPGESLTPGIAAVAGRQPHLPSGNVGTGPSVSFTRSGLTALWNSKYQSLLELAEACDVPVKWSCRTGVCHTCECALVGGTVAYQPDPLEAPAEGDVLICCARPQTDVEIDL